MGRIGELDLPARLRPYAPAWVTQIAFALMCIGAAVVLRAGVDSVAPSAGPFALIYPSVLIATLFAGWFSGLLTGAATLLLAWYFVLPVRGSFVFANPDDAARIVVIASANALLVAIAELFRGAVSSAAAERDREIAVRDLLLEEFEHRVKNNFALVASLLDMQRRRAGDAGTAQALGEALTRVESIARAHRHLYRDADSPGAVDMAAYLHELCATLAEALFLRGAITLSCEADPVAMPRDRAVSLGLVVNELVTNAAKHAFTGRESGTIAIRFHAEAAGWTLRVVDDGTGIPQKPEARRRDGGLGQRLIEAFVRQAGGTVATESGANGTVVTVTLAP